ncbi:dual specificity calcium/calmodulin-dependent 3',5'-cyclic nucleotide phosphodiesterase 1A-like [Eublepharis macularius]|uniref:Phosphodiesterase n=1 Tax=Eublepharis macularius TaxID=481883 RepID=A0AA97IW78_EUBMA|nr:dual specificity calcium/calmodulin-dependent 3',5'-cyclic nucleotide phosphodiesterase 1A-like [Eublepharis macularius]
MTQDKREKLGVKTNSSSAKSRTADQRAKKKLSATLLLQCSSSQPAGWSRWRTAHGGLQSWHPALLRPVLPIIPGCRLIVAASGPRQSPEPILPACKWCILDAEDELSEHQLDLLPTDIREWLTGTFTTKTEGCKAKPEEDKAKRRIISQAVEGSTSVIRQFRTSTSSTGIAYPAEVIAAFKEVDKWTFDVFALNEASQGHSLKYVMCEVFNKYDLLSRFQIPLTILIAFAEALEAGYNKYHNEYHNAIHAADVTQTVHSILLHTGTMHWFTDLEILAIFFSAIVHDYEHPGTTNNFHIQTKSEAALLYNDTSVLENHHLSAAYQLVQKPEFNILANLTPEEWREMRQLVIKTILATDMSCHFQHMKNTLRGLQQQERLDRSTVMSTIVHVADISHPAKPWELHQRWVAALMEEFFKQGAMEIQLGLPISPLCDRETTNIAESEIAFIDVIVKPVFTLLFEVVQKVIVPFLQKVAASSKGPCGSSITQPGPGTQLAFCGCVVGCQPKEVAGQPRPVVQPPVCKSGLPSLQ